MSAEVVVHGSHVTDIWRNSVAEVVKGIWTCVWCCKAAYLQWDLVRWYNSSAAVYEINILKENSYALLVILRRVLRCLIFWFAICTCWMSSFDILTVQTLSVVKSALTLSSDQIFNLVVHYLHSWRCYSVWSKVQMISYGPVDATATPSFFASLQSRLV